jgi:predicted RNase H-like nuclease (RuvC/YqgF family)
MTNVNSQARNKPHEVDITETEYEMKKTDYIGLITATKAAHEKIIKLKKEKLATKENVVCYQKALEKLKEEKQQLAKENQQLANKVTSYASELEGIKDKKHHSKVNDKELQDLFKWDEEEINRKALEAFKSDEKLQRELAELKKYLGL